MSDSVWKKEISLRRKKQPQEESVAAAPAAPEAPAEPKTSIWKKELSLGRKGKQPEAAREPVVAAEPGEPKASIWKKELSLGRKGKEPEAAREPVVAAQPGEPKPSIWKKELSLGRKAKEAEAALQPVVAADPGEPKTPFWKKEISFSRKQKQQEADRLAEEAAQIVARAFAPVPPPAVAPTSVAEAALAGEPGAEEAVVPAGQQPPEPAPPAPEPIPAAPEPVAAVPEPVAAGPEPVVDRPPPVALAPQPPDEPAQRSPLSVVPDPQPVAEEHAPAVLEPVVVPPPPQAFEPREPEGADVHPVELLDVGGAAPPAEAGPTPARQPAEQQPAAGPAPDPPAAGGYTPLSPEIVAASAGDETLPPLPAAPELDRRPADPTAAPDTVPAAEPRPAPAAGVEWHAADLPGAPAPAPPPQQEQQPVSVEPAAAPEPQWQPPLEEPEPWLAGPEAPPAPAPVPAAEVVVHPPVGADELPPLAVPKTPFWKKDLSFSRKPKEAKQSAPFEAQGPGEPKAPFWKRELSFSRSRTPKEFAAIEAALQALPAEPAAKTPFWKKDLSFSRKPKEAKASAPVEAPAPAEPQPPFWKRQLSLPSLSLPGLGGGRGGAHGKGAHKAKRIVGLKIGASQIAAARVSNNGVAELQQIARQPLAAGIVVGGELRDPDALAAALRSFFSKSKLPRKGVRLGIASNRIGVRTFDIVGVEGEKQIGNAIRFRAQEALPIPLDEAVLDYHILEESVDSEGRPVRRVLLVVAHRDLVDRYVTACRRAGVTLSGIDLEAFALLRSLAPPAERGASALVGVSIGFDRSTFAVSDGQVCEFTRVLEWGGWSLNVALARALDTAPSEVELLKRSLSLEGGPQPEGLSPENAAAALDAVRKQLQSFARELVSSLQFYQSQPGSLGIGEIVITGGTAEMPGLAHELERMIGVHVRVGNPLARLKVGKKVAQPDQLGSLAVAIGLGIED